MESIVITWRELLMVAVLILAVYIAEMLLLVRKGANPTHKPSWLDSLHEKQAGHDLNHEIEQIKLRLTLLEAGRDKPADVDSNEAGAYQRAIELARQGYDVANICESSGLSRGEVEMIVSMHGKLA